MAFPTLATHYDHQILGNEYCSGYTDLFGKWNTGFYCPQTGSSLAVYCCGTSVFKYCCTTRSSGSSYGHPIGTGEDDEGESVTSLYISDTPVIIAIACGIVAVLVLVIVASCFFCSCCFVYKKRSHVPGMYRMEDSSTTSGLANFHHSIPLSTSQQIHQQQSHTQSHSSSEEGIPNLSNTRPHPPQPPHQILTSHSNVIASVSLGGGGGGSGSSVTSSPLDIEWSQPPQHQQQPSLFHINNNHPSGISSNQSSNNSNNLLPPPARFASNQNLTTGSSSGGAIAVPMVFNRSNSISRDVPHQHQSYGSPYSLTSYEEGQSLSNPNPHQAYITSTLPSCLRRSGGSGASRGSFSLHHSNQSPMPTQQPQLKSILRNPRNVNNPNAPNTCVTSTYRRAGAPPGDFDFCEALLPQNNCYQVRPSEPYYSNTNYNHRPFTHDSSQRYPSPGPNTEYQNDLNRFDKDLDPESLSRLIELDLDSKL